MSQLSPHRVRKFSAQVIRWERCFWVSNLSFKYQEEKFTLLIIDNLKASSPAQIWLKEQRKRKKVRPCKVSPPGAHPLGTDLKGETANSTLRWGLESRKDLNLLSRRGLQTLAHTWGGMREEFKPSCIPKSLRKWLRKACPLGNSLQTGTNAAWGPWH